jgi:hypothetical protein
MSGMPLLLLNFFNLTASPIETLIPEASLVKITFGY